MQQQLLNSVLRIVHQGSFQADWTPQEVALAIEVPHEKLLEYFPEKEDLLAAISNQGLCELTTCMQAAADTKNSESIALEIGVAYIKFAASHPWQFRIMFQKYNRDTEEFKMVASTAFSVLASEIRTKSEAGVYRSEPNDLLALAAWTQVHGQACLLLDGVLTSAKPGSEAFLQFAEHLAREILPVLEVGMFRTST